MTLTNGIFAPEQSAVSIAGVTDGTSNTISHVEGLCGSTVKYNLPWRQYISGVLGTVPCCLLLNDARTNLPAVMGLAQKCMSLIQSGQSRDEQRPRTPLADRLPGTELDQHHPHAEFHAVPVLRLPMGLQDAGCGSTSVTFTCPAVTTRAA